MKKVFVVLSLMMFVGSMTSTAMAAVNGNKTELKKHDDKKKKKKSKKAACCAGGTAEGKTCPAGEKKSCGTEKK
jgi:hypothetical protein